MHSITLVFMLFFALNCFAQVDNTNAKAVKLHGLIIFTDCVPANNYETLGTVKSNTGGFGSSQYEAVRTRLIDNVKKEFPQADGIILYLNKGQADKADAIKFKQ